MDKKLNEEALENVTGGAFGMANPVSGLSKEEAEQIAAGLGSGQDMGSWRNMSKQEFMKWWEDSNGKTSTEIPGMGSLAFGDE